MSWITCKRISGRAVWFAVGALAAAAPASAADPAARVTVVTGRANAGGVAVEKQARLRDGDSLQTGGDGGCSILVDEDAMLELCPDTSLRLGRRDGPGDRPRVLELPRGEIRVLAGPRPAGQRIEVHTPAAIATIVGSVVYVSVDASGVTTIASAESEVRVESARRLGRPVTLAAGQQITVRPGAPLPRTTQKWDPDLSPAHGCLIDFRALAFEGARSRGDTRALEAITGQDALDGLPAVGAGGEGSRRAPERSAWIGREELEILQPIDTGALLDPASAAARAAPPPP
jgi:hypothetical protein